MAPLLIKTEFHTDAHSSRYCTVQYTGRKGRMKKEEEEEEEEEEGRYAGDRVESGGGGPKTGFFCARNG